MLIKVESDQNYTYFENKAIKLKSQQPRAGVERHHPANIQIESFLLLL